jgi:hypothetical protein
MTQNKWINYASRNAIKLKNNLLFEFLRKQRNCERKIKIKNIKEKN